MVTTIKSFFQLEKETSCKKKQTTSKEGNLTKRILSIGIIKRELRIKSKFGNVSEPWKLF